MKNGGEAVIDWLTEVIQQVWQTGKVPQEWKDATLIHIHIKWTKNECDNYCGISLLSVPGNVSGPIRENAGDSGTPIAGSTMRV